MTYLIRDGKLVFVPGESHPRGKVAPYDEGAVAMEVFAQPERGVVVIQFPKAVRWMALEADKVDELIKLLELHKAKLG
jgi:hypothetical protein